MLNILYLRTSTALQTPELQLSDIVSVLQPPVNYLLLKEHQSAWKENSKRPEFEKLLEMIKSGKVSAVYVWSLDRIYRNRKKLVTFFTLCKLYKVKVYSYCQRWLDGINNTPEPFNEIIMDLLINILGWIGEEESNVKSSRIRMATKIVDGVTYSHKGNLWGRQSFPKQTVDRVLKLHKEGLSIRKIASLVQVYDKNNNGKNISKSSVQKLLAENALQKGS